MFLVSIEEIFRNLKRSIEDKYFSKKLKVMILIIK